MTSACFRKRVLFFFLYLAYAFVGGYVALRIFTSMHLLKVQRCSMFREHELKRCQKCRRMRFVAICICQRISVKVPIVRFVGYMRSKRCQDGSNVSLNLPIRLWMIRHRKAVLMDIIRQTPWKKFHVNHPPMSCTCSSGRPHLNTQDFTMCFATLAAEIRFIGMVLVIF